MTGASRHRPPFVFHDRGLCHRSNLDFALGAALSPPAPSAYHHHSSKRTSVNFLPERVAVDVWVCSRERAQPHPAFHPRSFSWALLFASTTLFLYRYCWQRGSDSSYPGRNDATVSGPCLGLRRTTRSISSSLHSTISTLQAARYGRSRPLRQASIKWGSRSL